MSLPLSSSSHGLPFHEAFTTSSDSPEGKHLLRNSRSLYNNNGNYYSSSISLKNYSIKFESCHTVLSFKNDEDDEDRRRRKRERRKTKRRTQQTETQQETHEARNRKLSGDGDGSGDGSGSGDGDGDGDSGDGDSGSGDSGSGSGDGWDGTGGGVQYQRMVKFRLCPVNDCSNKSSNGCKSEYGEYVVDMATFLEAYVQDKQANLSTFCEATKYNSCSCNSDDNSYGGSSSCEISCFSSLGLDECVLYAQQQKYGSSGFSLDYFSGQCQYLNYKNGNNQNYNNNNYYDDDEDEDEDGDSGSDSGSGDEDGDGSGSGSGDGDRRKRDRELGWLSWFNDDNGASSSSYNSNSNYNSNSGSSSYNSNYNSYGYSSSNYYLGPYCSSDGKAIHMGLFKDSSCSVFADSYKGGGGYTYKVKTGSELPYNSNTTYSLVDKKCQNCVLESSSYNSGSSTISENTQTMYLKSAKCESSLYSTSYPNTDGCSYINGIAKLEKMQMGTGGGGSILYW
eukprot:CAMPEP_0178949092 /NCGR_PEP_ID=MMETSP0789-20121207/5843_1 /TAXON_ID=3005 /ORGANISM="Rhizosolenia setigera, Strain CCMP 1694" /LENGTH=506 /DNA_ID=CAMNT_0020629545 /DNA_START=191 /DNA_END=1708 /DNA_ORIENTATION=-